jgi:hypothetical protein
MFMVKKTAKGFKYWSHRAELEYLSDALDLALGIEYNPEAHQMLLLINKRLDRQTRSFYAETT